MKGIWVIVGATAMLAACSRNPQAVTAAKVETPEPLKATVWTAGGELYLEYPPLVRNQKERFAIHLTRLTDFRAVKDASCEVDLDKDAESQVFPCDPSTHPGIFGANVQPKSEGKERLRIVVHGRGLSETFEVGMVKIAADAESAERPAESKEETISFSKEQQWALDFGTQIVAAQNLRDNLRVAAETLPRTGGEASVIAPIAGRLIVEKALSVGTAVQQGVELASMIPPIGTVSDLASLQLAEAEAKVAVELAA